ncbi:MAG: hypothetical protein MZV64_19300 [Ignavibacteriales bacterium]|nr:hypothetical protein [Ignavibacteriales bacterium]
MAGRYGRTWRKSGRTAGSSVLIGVSIRTLVDHVRPWLCESPRTGSIPLTSYPEHGGTVRQLCCRLRRLLITGRCLRFGYYLLRQDRHTACWRLRSSTGIVDARSSPASRAVTMFGGGNRTETDQNWSIALVVVVLLILFGVLHPDRALPGEVDLRIIRRDRDGLSSGRFYIFKRAKICHHES